MIDKYIAYIRDIRRYSSRTADIYRDVLNRFASYSGASDDILQGMDHQTIRAYEVKLLDDGLSPRTVNLHLSVLSGFCRFLVKEGLLKSNPVSIVPKPKVSKRLPVFFKKDSMDHYFSTTAIYASEEFLNAFMADVSSRQARHLYERRLSRLIVSMLYGTGMRRSEIISLNISSVDFGRKVVKVHGKGDKMREIPLVDALYEEILLYLKAVEALVESVRSLNEPLLITYTGRRIYPGYVEKAVKTELSAEGGFTGRKSPHVLRHSLATDLLDHDTDLNSIKELLGHSSLAATQVYTHNTVAKLKNIYKSAHPRAKNGGKNGD